jgi:dienelactone hydrolase
VKDSRLRRVGRWIRRVWATMLPGRIAWRGASRGLLASTALVLALASWDALAQPSPNVVSLLVTAAFVAFMAVVGLAFLLLRWLARTPSRLYIWALGASLALVVPIFAAMASPIVAIGLVVASSLLGAGLASLGTTGWRSLGWLRRALALGALVIGVAAVGVGTWGFLSDGRALEAVPNAALTATSLPQLDLPDPSRAGPFKVRTLTYGSRTDRRRPEFGPRVALRTKPVDASKLVERWDGRIGWMRTRYWGFDARQLPLQGRVWYPDGAGPFPLVLAVHGNHQMEEFSDPGYAYLGELLASRGCIFVSVDENFLNSSFGDLIGVPDVGLKEENGARAWMLLQHLRVWREWQTAPGNLFQGRVDMSRIGLIGHSRGGEAVAVAAAFNRLPYYPDDARVRFDFNFDIRSVVAIAPVDGQYKPGGTWTRPENVNYFVLHGSMDGDVESFHGSRVFERVRFTDGRPHFKATLYIHGANHGQFNTVWGRSDNGWLGGRFLNLAGIMAPDDQRRIAKAFISAFLDATLHDRAGYSLLFRDWRRGRGWLPAAVYLQHFEDAADRRVATFEEDLDLTSTTIAGGRIESANLSDWKERELSIKWGSLDTRAVKLGWNRDEYAGVPSYTIRLPESGLDLAGDESLFFALADTAETPTMPEGRKDAAKKVKDEAKKAKKPEKPIDLTVELTDAAGAIVRMPLSSFGALQRQVEAQVPKFAFLGHNARSELVFTNFELPLAAFAKANPGFDPRRLRQVRFVFDRTSKGVVALDDLGFRR